MARTKEGGKVFHNKTPQDKFPRVNQVNSVEDNNKSEPEDDVVSEVEEDDKWKDSDFEPDTAELSSNDSEAWW